MAGRGRGGFRGGRGGGGGRGGYGGSGYDAGPPEYVEGKICFLHLICEKWGSFCNRAKEILFASRQTKKSLTLTHLSFWKTSSKLEKWMTFLAR